MHFACIVAFFKGTVGPSEWVPYSEDDYDQNEKGNGILSVWVPLPGKRKGGRSFRTKCYYDRDEKIRK